MKNKKNYNVGIYIRLSRDSAAGRDIPSMSIENQQAMLSEFVSMMPGWALRHVYVDDGAGGGNFIREGFCQMMEDIRTGVINLVLVQDLSRFGRNYLEAGRYLEEELPALDCRFVALADGIDTEDGENDIIPFLNMMNDYYLKNLKDRVIAALRAKAKDGQKLSGSVPFGYIRNPKERTRLIIDENAVGVVKWIFKMRAEEMSYAKIVAALNNGAVPPSKRNPDGIWKTSTIKKMLANESYIGHTISFKRKPRSYRNDKGGIRDESQWIRAENTHETIVDLELWQKVQEVNRLTKSKFAHSRKPQQSLFSGLAVCANCHANMAFQLDRKTTSAKGNILYGGYLCKAPCPGHRISEMALKRLVIADIKEQAGVIVFDENRMLKALKQNGCANNAKEQKDLMRQRHKLEIRLEQLYEDKVAGNITADTFANLADDMELKILEAEEKLGAISLSAKRMEMIKAASVLAETERDMLESLIEKIEVGEKAIIDGVKTQDIKVFWKYAGMQ